MDISKLFGGKGSSNGNDGASSDRSSRGKHIYDFDPTGLERAAKSAKQLQDHPQAARILEVAITEALNKRQEILKEQKAYDLRIEQAKIDGVKQQHDCTVEILREEAKTHRTKAEYEDFLARKRTEDRMELEKHSQHELLKTQEDSVKRQEELRKQTIDYEFTKRVANEKELSAAFWKNKSIYKKETQDISMSKYAMKMENDFKRTQMIMSSVESMITNSFNMFYENKKKFMAFTTGLCILTGGLVFSRRGVVLGLKKLESYLFTPKLIKEYKKEKILSRLFSPVQARQNILLEKEGLIYNKGTENTLTEIINSTTISRNNQGVLRNFLFYGPPGTGKTLFAKKLAHNSGMNYAILTGGDVVPLREKAVTELHKVFDWSARSRGLILFLDEADAFLKKRDRVEIGEEMRSALNSFLYRTGESSKNLMLILATNKPEQLDRAVTDRIDMLVQFPLPDENTRKRLFNHYFSMLIKNGVSLKGFELADIIDDIVRLSIGFSAREITKLCTQWQAYAFSRSGRTIDAEMMMEGIQSMGHQHKTKQAWDEIEVEYTPKIENKRQNLISL